MSRVAGLADHRARHCAVDAGPMASLFIALKPASSTSRGLLPSISVNIDPSELHLSSNIPTDMGTYASPGPDTTQRMRANAKRDPRWPDVHQPLKAPGLATTLRKTALFLANERRRQRTGQVLSVDGGPPLRETRAVRSRNSRRHAANALQR